MATIAQRRARGRNWQLKVITGCNYLVKKAVSDLQKAGFNDDELHAVSIAATTAQYDIDNLIEIITKLSNNEWWFALTKRNQKRRKKPK